MNVIFLGENIVENNKKVWQVEIKNKIINLTKSEYFILKFLYDRKDIRVAGYIINNEVLPNAKLEYINWKIIPSINEKCENIILETRIGNCYYIEG